MSHRYPLLTLITVVIVVITAYSAYRFPGTTNIGLPFAAVPADARTAVVELVTGIPLPSGLEAGDRIDLPASRYAARVALLPWILVETNISANHSYHYAVRRDHALTSVSVNSANVHSANGGSLLVWVLESNLVLYAAVALLLLWRARGRASLCMLAWVVASWLGTIVSVTPLAGDALLAAQVTATVFFLVARTGFYFTIEFLLAEVLTPAQRAWFRTIFIPGIGGQCDAAAWRHPPVRIHGLG